MELIQRIENIIKYDKPIDEQLDILSQFDNLSEEEKTGLTTRIKSPEVGTLIEYLGFEKLRNQLPSFLEFLQDANWPASAGASKMLVKAGEIIIPEIKRVFMEVRNDQIWHYWILILIIQDWDKKLVSSIKPELIELINKADKEGASIQALNILRNKELLEEIEVEFYYQYLLKRYEGDKYWIADLNDVIKAKH